MHWRVRELLDGMTDRGGFPSDVQGSYTGMTDDGERPVQDADDL